MGRAGQRAGQWQRAEGAGQGRAVRFRILGFRVGLGLKVQVVGFQGSIWDSRGRLSED